MSLQQSLMRLFHHTTSNPHPAPKFPRAWGKTFHSLVALSSTPRTSKLQVPSLLDATGRTPLSQCGFANGCPLGVCVRMGLKRSWAEAWLAVTALLRMQGLGRSGWELGPNSPWGDGEEVKRSRSPGWNRQWDFFLLPCDSHPFVVSAQGSECPLKLLQFEQ